MRWPFGKLSDIFSLTPEELSSPDLNGKIVHQVQRAIQNLREAQLTKEDYQTINSLTGMRNHTRNWPVITRNIFSNTSSFIDILVNNNPGEIIDVWEGAIKNAKAVHEKRLLFD